MLLKLAHQKIAEVAPIEGVSSDGRIDFLPTATDDQRLAAQAMLDNWVDPPKPDWPGFRTALYAEDAWKRVLNSNPAVGATIASILWQFQTDPTLAAEVKFLWDSLIPGLDPALSVDEITALNLIAIDNNVPMVVEDDGFLSFSD
ncbi:MAG: hypothetical protein ACO3S8_05000 [Aquiluna sp.]